MPAANYNITVDQHSDFSRSFSVKLNGEVQDITGYTFAAQMRERLQSDTSYDFTCLVTNALQGTFTVTMTDTQTAQIPAGEYSWDLVMTAQNGDKTRLLQGIADVSGGVTR